MKTARLMMWHQLNGRCLPTSQTLLLPNSERCALQSLLNDLPWWWRSLDPQSRSAHIHQTTSHRNGDGHLSLGAPFGEPGGGLVYLGLWEKYEGGCGNGASLFEELSWRGPWGGKGGELLLWGPWKICSDSLRVWASLTIGAPAVPKGTFVWGGGLIYRGLWKMDEGGLLTGELYDMLSKARKWAPISVGAPLLGNMDGRFFLGAFLLEESLLGLLEICKCPVDEYLST